MVVECYICHPGRRTGGGGEAGNELLFSSSGVEKQHGIVFRRRLKVDLCKTSECAAPKSRIYGTQIIEKSFRLRAGQRACKCHDRIIKREIISLRVIGTEVSGSTLA